MATWLGVDIGAARTGVAVGDTETRVAAPLEVIPSEPVRNVFSAVRALADEHGAGGVVVGLPLNMDGSEGSQSRRARKFAEDLGGATGLEVRLWDERLSSYQADDKLKDKFTRKKTQARQDAVAAAVFLGEFLREQGGKTDAR